jgi:CheY-like chemotaxis protein
MSDRRLVVVVDAEPDTVMGLLASLRDLGYDAVGYASGKAALEGIQKLDPDVIISDITMPNPNGWDIARQVRKLKGNGERPLLIATSALQYKEGADRLLAHTAGFNFYLTKPCDPRALMVLIEGARPK